MSEPRLPVEFSILSPIYNEAGNIEAHLRGIEQNVRGRYEIVLVYDSEDDNTLPAIKAMDPPVANLRLMRNQFGRGVVPAIRTGFLASRGTLGCIVTMADLSDPPKYINPLVDKLRAGFDIVSGSRYMPGGRQHGGPRFKGFLSYLSGVLAWWLTGIGTHDVTTNFRAYSRRVIEQIPLESQGAFEVGLELTVKAHLRGWLVGEVPAEWHDRKSGESQFRLFKLLPGYLRWYTKLLLGDPFGWRFRRAAHRPAPNDFQYFGVYDQPNYGWIVRRHRPGIVVLARTSSGKTVWIRCARPFHEQGASGWELPGGEPNDGETWEEAARRELREETGYVGERAIVLPHLYEATPGMGTFPHVVVMIDQARREQRITADGGGGHEEGIIEVREFDESEVSALLSEGKIQSLPSLAAIAIAQTTNKSDSGP